MSIVFIIGGSGDLGRRLSKKLASKGHISRPLFRKPGQDEELKGYNIHPVHGDILNMSTDELASKISGSDAVVFTAGAGGNDDPEMTQKVDGEGLTKTILSAKISGIKRLILVSAFPEASRDKPYSSSRESYLHVKKMSEVELACSDLNWVILRAGILNDSSGNGKVRLAQAVPFGKVTRDDVAETLTAIIEEDTINHHILEVTEGNETIAEAVHKLTNSS